MQIQIPINDFKNNFPIIENEIDYFLKVNFEQIREKMSNGLRIFRRKAVSNKAVLKEIEEENLNKYTGLIIQRAQIEDIYRRFVLLYNSNMIDYITLEGAEMEIFLSATNHK